MLSRGFVSTLAVVLVCMLQTASAQESEQDSSSIIEQDSSDTVEQDSPDAIDEIIVQGEMTLSRLRHRADAKEDVFYELFNAINDDDEFDVRCVDEAPIGSRVKKRVCKANFEIEASAEEARGIRLGIPTQTAFGEMTQKQAAFQERMEVLVNENPQLLKALTEFGDAKSDYESEKEKWCSGGLLTCSKPE